MIYYDVSRCEKYKWERYTHQTMIKAMKQASAWHSSFTLQSCQENSLLTLSPPVMFHWKLIQDLQEKHQITSTKYMFLLTALLIIHYNLKWGFQSFWTGP